MKPLRIPLRIIFYKEGNRWIAHCLEFDVLGDGKTQEEALGLLAKAIVIQIQVSIEHKNSRNLFSPADGKYFAMFAAGRDVAIGKLELTGADSMTIEEPEAREYSGSDVELAFA